MLLHDILQGVAYTECGGNPDIINITEDSRKASAGSLFVCHVGLHVDGHTFIPAAVAQGVSAIVCSKLPEPLPENVAFVKVTDTRAALARIAANFYRRPVETLCMLGVTGTNGKTSTTYFVEAILRAWGKKAGVLGTSGARVGDTVIDIPYATSSTPDSIELHHILRAMADAGAAYCAMEATSHALALQKAEGIPFKVGMFTNLTQDHLDFHGTMGNYCAEKAKLFKQCEIAVINADDPYAKVMTEGAGCRAVTYGIDADCDYKATNVVLTHEGVRYDIRHGDETIHIESPVPGRFSVYNTLCAAAAALEIGVPSECVREGLANLANVPGRIQSVPNSRGIGVIVDYAHTPDGVDNILRAVRGFTAGRVITVVGCGGDRDRTKRPIMGEIAGRGSDYVILTSDNPRSEKPEDIISEMEPGVCKTACPYTKEPDRRKAICAAVSMAKPGDSVVLAGKGSEDYQEFENKRRVPFDDVRTAAEALEAYR